MEENGRLSSKQQKGILALLNEPTIRDAANVCKVGETTLYTWLNDPAFSAEYQQARSRVFEATLTSLQASGCEAVKTLVSIMKDEAAPPASRVAAARSVLDFTLRAKTEIEMEARLQTLEKQLQTGGQNENFPKSNWTN